MYESPKKMKNQRLNSDIISTLPQNIIETILTLMPIRDALRTSVLSKKWRYSWRSMPRLVFTNTMVKIRSNCTKYGCGRLEKYKLVNAIFHVLLLHNGPKTLEFHCSVGLLQMGSEFVQIISYIARGNKLKELVFAFDDSFYKLPVSFFSLQGLQLIRLVKCTFEPPLTFNGFSQLKSLTFINVKVSAQMLQRFLSKCPLLEHICLSGGVQGVDFEAGGSKFTFLDLFRCVPLIKVLDVAKYYSKYLSADGMPYKLPTPLVHLDTLLLDVCLMEQCEISSALSIIRSSPVVNKIIIGMRHNEELPAQQTPLNFLDLEDHSDLKLDYLETLEIECFSNLPLEMEFVKLIMAKAPVLKKVLIMLDGDFSVDEELKMYKSLILLPFPRASPYAKLIVK